jgi:hypothetical protein
MFHAKPDKQEFATVLELGSGQSMATVHLLDALADSVDEFRLAKSHKVYLSDLPDVIPLCQASVARWEISRAETLRHQQVEAEVVPLAWGDMDMGDRLGQILQTSERHLSHILLIDLVRSRPQGGQPGYHCLR